MQASEAVSDSFLTPWTVAHQAPLSIGFPRQEYWSGLHFLLWKFSPIQGPHPHLLHRQAGLLPLSNLGREGDR